MTVLDKPKQKGTQMSTDYKPSQVVLREATPLIDTFEKAFAEQAGAMLVRACARNGDVWQAVWAKDMGAAIKLDVEEKIEPLFSCNTNPFFRPDFHLLIDKGFAEFVGDDDEGLKRPIRFTDAGLKAMSKWVRR